MSFWHCACSINVFNHTCGRCQWLSKFCAIDRKSAFPDAVIWVFSVTTRDAVCIVTNITRQKDK